MSLFKLLLTIHIVAGMLSLIIGGIVLSTKKGNKQHKRIGNIFFYLMATSALVSLPMAIMHKNYFLFAIGFFTLYMIFSGVNYLAIKKHTDFNLKHKTVSFVLTLFMLFLLYIGVLNVYKGVMFGIVFIFFAALAALFIKQDYSYFKGKSTFKNFGLIAHIQRMVGSYIATITAFIVVNNKWLPNIVGWLLPTFILVPLIIKWIKKYKVQIPATQLKN